jgi:tetratricopeptide (TPR) repeat protein
LRRFFVAPKMTIFVRMSNSIKQDAVFELIRSMSKAEKRNFKLYATRLEGNQDAKFIVLFDAFDALDEYNEEKILKKCPVKKEQLANMKAHLYRQILVSIRLLDVQHSVGMQIREQIDFSRILYDKGQYRQSLRHLDRARELAEADGEHTLALEVIEAQKAIESVFPTRSMAGRSTVLSRAADRQVRIVSRVGELSNLANILYSLHLKLGYARSEKDIEAIDRHYKPVLDKYNGKKPTFLETIYYCQAAVWYNYIRHDFARSFRYAQQWLSTYEAFPRMKETLYDNFLKGMSRLLEGLFLSGSYRRYVRTLERLESNREAICSLNVNADILYRQVDYVARINRHYMEGSFDEGVDLVPEIEEFLKKYGEKIGLHLRMLFDYKIACLYFGRADHKKCMSYLQRVIATRDPQVRRDLQCYARILHLIASYEAGLDYNLDYQIRSTYAFLVKMNDLHAVQRELIVFLKGLHATADADFKVELEALYGKLLPYTTHPYERRTFFYLDLISWLESKIRNVPVATVIREKFQAQLRTNH